MDNNNEVTVYINEEEAMQFIEFRKNYENYLILAENRVFEQKGAAIILNFDKFGVIRSINRSDVLYDHRSKFENTN